MDRQRVRILDVETASAIESGTVMIGQDPSQIVSHICDGEVMIERAEHGPLVFSAPGYEDKIYETGSCPEIVRLISSRPAVFIEQPSCSPHDVVIARVHAPHGCEVRLVGAHSMKGVNHEYVLPRCSPCHGSVPDHDVVRNGLDWPAYRFRLPDLPSGIWLLELRHGTLKTYAPLVVRRSASQSRAPLVVTASVATWACYNYWGGRSRYRNGESGAVDASSDGSRSVVSRVRSFVGGVLARAIPEIPRTRIKRWFGVDSTVTSWVSSPLSWRRPWGSYFEFNVRPYEPVLNHLLALDAKILQWLDENDFDYECVADLDLDKDMSLLDERAAVALLGHSEYWSTSMYRALHSAHMYGGVWVLNLSGNSLYRSITVLEDYSVKLNDILMRLTGTDETEITGVRYSATAYGTASPYKVVAASHWALSGCHLKVGDTFGVECLIRNVPTREIPYNPAIPTTWDRRLDGEGAAGFEVDRMPLRRRAEFVLLAEGISRRSAQMVLREPRGSRGGSFSVSSISFGGALLVDPICAQIVRNVLGRALRRDHLTPGA